MCGGLTLKVNLNKRPNNYNINLLKEMSATEGRGFIAKIGYESKRVMCIELPPLTNMISLFPP